MTVLNALFFSFLLTFPSPPTRDIERAFLENSPEVLRGLFTISGDIPVSLPDPLSCADQVSPDQAYFLFKQIFEVYKTLEFYVDSRVSTLPGKPGGILNARWSFRNQRTGNQYPFRVFFYLSPERTPTASRDRPNRITLRIVEIRAERL